MKRSMLISGLLLLTICGFSQMNKQQATKMVLNTIVGDDVESVNVYMEPTLKSAPYYKMSYFDSISSPYNNYWLFFIDDMPEYGWGHYCRYVFVNPNDGATSVVNSQMPPLHYKLHLDVVSEPLSFSIPTTNNATSNHNTVNYNYPSNDGKYAVLFTGGETDGSSLRVFWNALSHAYCGLLENGFRKENIFVLSCDGSVAPPASNHSLDLDGDGDDDILNDTCNIMGLSRVFDSLSHKVNDGDMLYLFGTTHGFQDPLDNSRYFLHLWEGERLYDTTFSNMLSSVSCSQYIVNLWSCFSGAIMQEFLSHLSDSRKTVLTCIGDRGVWRHPGFIRRSGMDVYNYFMNSALRNRHPFYPDSVWIQGGLIGQLYDDTLFGCTANPIDINYDFLIHGGNGNGIHEIGEAIDYTKHFDPSQFGQYGVKHYECGFDTIDDLLSLRGITGTVRQKQTVQGNFHIEDTLSICADTLTLTTGGKFYLFDADVVVQEGSLLRMLNETSVIARSGNCRLVIRGSMEMGSRMSFEAKDGASLEIVFQNDTAVSINDASFVNCTLTLPKKSIAFSNCNFRGTGVSAQINSFQNTGNEVVALNNCSFVPNGSTIENAIYIKGYSSFMINGCVIENPDNEGSFNHGINVHNSGSVSAGSVVANNEITKCSMVGLQFYHSNGNIRNNRIHNNGIGVKLLNNSNVGEFTGRCYAQTAEGTQFIHDNERDEVFMTSSCVPEVFRYNAISDDDDIPFLYYEVSGDVNGNDSLYRAPIDVTYNYWGTNFLPNTHLYPNPIDYYQYLPKWSLGTCYGNGHEPGIDGNRLVAEADSLAGMGAYSAAELLYKQVVENYPRTVSAETALKSLLNLERQRNGDFESLQDYYLTNEVIASDANLTHLSSSLANKCDEELELYANAISWYETVLDDPETTFSDSIFAAIDLGDLYLELEQVGEKGFYGKKEQYVPKSAKAHQKRTEYLLSLLPVVKDESMERENLPITNLEAAVYDNDTVFLTWDLPESPANHHVTLSWIKSDTIDYGTSYENDNYLANKYDTFDLRAFIGWKLESISFFKISNWTHYIYVWEQKQGEAMRVLYSQLVPEDTPFGLNTIILEEDFQIEPFTRYWFGLRIRRDDHYGYSFPLGVVQGEQGVDGKSNLFLVNNTWETIPYNMHVWLKVCLVDASKETKRLQFSQENEALTGYRIYRDDELINEIPYSFVTYFKDAEYAREFDVEYCVTAVYGDEESEPVCVTATITGVHEPHTDHGIVIFPNPTNGVFRIEGATAAEVEVYNTLGQLVKTIRNTNEINLKNLSQGIYALHITTENGAVHYQTIVKE